MAAEPVMKYAVILLTSINTPKASEIRMAKRISRSSPSSRGEVLRRDVIAVVTAEPGLGAVRSKARKGRQSLAGCLHPPFAFPHDGGPLRACR